MNLKCVRCGHEWNSRTKDPKVCPNCKGRLNVEPRSRNIIDIQISGYVLIPTRPGVGVKVDISDPDYIIGEILTLLSNVPKNQRYKLENVITEILSEKDKTRKNDKICRLVVLSNGINAIGYEIGILSVWLENALWKSE